MGNYFYIFLLKLSPRQKLCTIYCTLLFTKQSKKNCQLSLYVGPLARWNGHRVVDSNSTTRFLHQIPALLLLVCLYSDSLLKQVDIKKNCFNYYFLTASNSRLSKNCVHWAVNNIIFIIFITKDDHYKKTFFFLYYSNTPILYSLIFKSYNVKIICIINIFYIFERLFFEVTVKISVGTLLEWSWFAISAESRLFRSGNIKVVIKPTSRT